jgi:hypothetical protein
MTTTTEHLPNISLKAVLAYAKANGASYVKFGVDEDDSPRVPHHTARIEAMFASARTGKMPDPPDFSAPTHAGYRGTLARFVQMAKAGDIEGLRADPLEPKSSSRIILDRYRQLAIIALEAKIAIRAERISAGKH